MGRLMTRTLLLLVLLGGLTPAFTSDHDEALRLKQAGEILPLKTILERLQQPGQILEVELEHKQGRLVYELELLDEQGRVWEFYFDAASGEMIKKKIEN
ncbi:hypothetical protein Rifp1Sym_ad00100 [endosymbiont of Riftia pachyptila (vent Ph05)]|jgi:uncharacterized membrane protein YkoI|uniref:PepSY domain-containing protein n=3 Tax=Gammaproteobacteria TaxID=1236 RepID=G2D9K1_9GAMM|nr:hypothetical protein Rifp1Sym_ad00100 [endosymbiont of Riftia pachyptila (vent Ph05)]